MTAPPERLPLAQPPGDLTPSPAPSAPAPAGRPSLLRSLLSAWLLKLHPELHLQLRAYNALIRNRNSYLHQTGWMESLRASQPMDSQGRPVPWMSFPVVKLLDERLQKDFSLFEFGSGYSTHFYAARVASVVSVEYDRHWFELLRMQLPANVELVFRERDVDGVYCRSIHAGDRRYDVVIVDGRDRVNCIRESISALTPRGVIVLDDSQREEYGAGLSLAKAQGFRALDLEGLKATGSETDRSTLLYRDGNCLGI